MNADIYSRTFLPGDKEALLYYLAKAYPKRQSLEAFVDFTLFRVPKAGGERSILVFKNGEIIGANMFLQTHARIGVDEYPIVWSYDTKVLDEYRNTDAGTILCGEAFFVKNIFGAGLSAISKEINKRIHSRFIAKSTAFIRLNINLFTSIFHIFLRKHEVVLPDSRYPNHVKTRLGIFSRFNNVADLYQPQGNYWNENILEFERSVEFLKWRFFSFRDKYQMYVCHLNDKCRNDIYFVCRQYSLYGMPILYIVDYRFDVNNQAEQEAIIEAASALAMELKFAGVYIRSSLSGFSGILRKYSFLEKKGGADIVTRFKPAFEYESKVFHTSADSDMDFKISY